jgi:hypothetical protein
MFSLLHKAYCFICYKSLELKGTTYIFALFKINLNKQHAKVQEERRTNEAG